MWVYQRVSPFDTTNLTWILDPEQLTCRSFSQPSILHVSTCTSRVAFQGKIPYFPTSMDEFSVKFYMFKPRFTLWLCQIAIDNGQKLWVFPVTMVNFKSYVTNYQKVNPIKSNKIPITHHFPIVVLWWWFIVFGCLPEGAIQIWIQGWDKEAAGCPHCHSFWCRRRGEMHQT